MPQTIVENSEISIVSFIMIETCETTNIQTLTYIIVR